MTKRKSAPPAQGVRQKWEDIPISVRDKIENWLGSQVSKAHTQPAGFSPGVASRLEIADGRTVFLKAIGSDINPKSPQYHRREAHMMQSLPLTEFAPSLLWYLDDTESGWVILVFEDIDGHNPSVPWIEEELQKVVDCIIHMSTVLKAGLVEDATIPHASTKFHNDYHGWQKLQESPYLSQVDGWIVRNISKLVDLESNAGDAVKGDTLLHLDLRADNIVLTPERVWVVDWPHVTIGAEWLDIVFFAPSVGMQDGLPPEQLCQLHPAYKNANVDDISAAIAAIAGVFIYHSFLPPPQGLPTLRPFMKAQGDVACDWLRQRTQWE